MGLLGAFAAVAAALGVSTFSGTLPTAQAQVPAGLTVTKACTVGTVAPNGGLSTCTVTITNTTAADIIIPDTAGGVAIQVNVTAGNGGTTSTTGFGQLRILEGTSSATGADVDTVTVTNVTGAPQAITAGGTGTDLTIPAAGTVVFTIAEAGAVGGTTAESIQFSTGAPGAGVLGTAVPLTGTNAPVTVSAATTVATVSCAPVSINVGSGGTGSTCTLDLDDNDAFAETVSSGTVTIAGTALPTGTVLSAQGQMGATLAGLRCPSAGGTGLPQGCDNLVFNVISNTGSTVTGNVSVAVTYTPDLSTVNSPLAGVAFANIVAVIQPVAAFVAPTAITIACGTPPAIIFSPGPIAALPGTPIQIGILPTALACTVTPTPGSVAAGTIEVSSVNGALLDANGRITTNLRINCGDPTVITLNLGTTIDPNTCQGVRFAVAGLNVGSVELRARYEPSNAASQAGVPERETAASVFFVAPNPCAGTVGCSLLLSPNPVTVGQTGTATMRFGREFLACGTGIICVDPTTGGPILVNQGSILNGQVVFTIADSVIATFVAAQPTATTPAPSSTTGFTTTANQTIVRCGFFPTTTLPSGAVNTPFIGGAAPLSNFFGGCETATATYRGVAPGLTAINASFIPDLPGATGILSALPPANFPQQTTFQSSRTLEVIGAAPVGDVMLARGCNNVSPTVSEAASAYAARVNPAGALVALWEHQAATNTFRGWSPAAGAPNDLAAVTRLRPVFVCTSGAATLAQPPA
jgi:hypothetical protein